MTARSQTRRNPHRIRSHLMEVTTPKRRITNQMTGTIPMLMRRIDRMKTTGQIEPMLLTVRPPTPMGIMRTPMMTTTRQNRIRIRTRIRTASQRMRKTEKPLMTPMRMTDRLIPNVTRLTVTTGRGKVNPKTRRMATRMQTKTTQIRTRMRLIRKLLKRQLPRRTLLSRLRSTIKTS